MQYKDFATKEEELKLIRFYQNDLNSAKLLINVTHDKVVTDFSTATKVQIAFLKPDGKRVFQEVQNVNQMQGKYYVVLSTQTLIAYGNVIAQLRLTFPNNKVIETCKFVFAVDESIMSDEAMASTNEFPVIQKAIEAGEKLEGVDINGIIAAGALAAGALPKTGGVVAGDITFDNTKSLNFKTTQAGKSYNLYTGANNNIYLYDNIGNTRVFGYDPATKTFDVPVSTNLLKTTGGVLTGSLEFDAGATERRIFVKAGAEHFGHLFNSKATGIYNWRMDKFAMSYNAETDTFNVGANNTNLLKTTGGGLTGDVSITGANKGLKVTNATEGLTQSVDTNGVYYWYATSTKTPLRYDIKSDILTVNANFKTAKDGRVDLTLTANGENFNGNIGPIADRKGSTVMFRAGIRRRADATGPVVTTLPVDMRPTLTVIQVVPANDGTLARITIQTTGDVQLESAGSTSIIGKDVYMAITYLANN
ncbi:BppU family phage baseplate upper protein [Bacillus paramobilis]|uniref:BppU family phage baseplate upper protein n=1 Tax=Bacillus paramobilis TaxID=2817477 RepID=UPI003216A9E9